MTVKLFKTKKLLSNQFKEEEENLFKADNDIIEPPINFSSLYFIFENSSIISGIVKKIATKTNTGFEITENEKLDNFLKNLDVIFLVENLVIFGICAFERLKTLQNKPTLELEEFVTTQIRISSNPEYKIYQKSSNNSDKIGFKKEEILFFRTKSLVNKNYGDSFFSKAFDELILLAFITKYYKNFFGSGNIEPNVLFDETGQLTDEQIEKIENMINDKLSGIDNSHNTVFVSGKIGKVDLSTKIDPDKFINLKRELKEDIAIALNIPFDLLSSKDSNRATAISALKSFYNDIISPLQLTIENQLKKQLKDFLDSGNLEGISLEDIEKIKFRNVNLNDPKEEMETLTGYQKNGVLSVNEVRAKAGLGPAIEGGDEYKIIGNKDDKKDLEDEEIKKIEYNLKKIYEN